MEGLGINLLFKSLCDHFYIGHYLHMFKTKKYDMSCIEYTMEKCGVYAPMYLGHSFAVLPEERTVLNRGF